MLLPTPNAALSATKTVLEQLELLGYGPSFRKELFAMLDESPMFCRFSRDDLNVLSENLLAYKAPAALQLMEEGAFDPFMCLLAAGRLEVVKRDDAGVERRLAVIHRGRTFGEMSLIDGQPHSATIRTLEPCTLVVLTRDHFKQIIQSSPRTAFQITYRIATLLSNRLRQTSGKLVEHLEADSP